MVLSCRTVSFALFSLVFLSALAVSCTFGRQAPKPDATTAPAVSVPTASPEPLPPLPEDLSLVALVSKQQALPASYTPADLVALPPQYVSSAASQRLRRPAAEAL